MLIIICNDDNKYSHTHKHHIETISLAIYMQCISKSGGELKV